MAVVSAEADAAQPFGLRRAVAPFGAMLALCRRRLNARLGARAGWLMAIAVALATLIMAAALEPQERTHAALVERALRWLCWLGAGPVAVAAAGANLRRDRDQGVEALAMLYGARGGGLNAARTAAVMVEATLRVAVPGVALCLLLATFGPTALMLLEAVVAALAAVLCGLVLGGVAASCGAYGQPRGRTLLLAVVFVPWVIADLWAVPALSLPGALDAVLSFVARLVVPAGWA